jgi:hypothetical protein
METITLKETDASRRLLVATAHPDDETFGPAGTIIRYARSGVAVHVICATRGEVGHVDPELLEGYDSLADLRTQELLCAARHLGLAGLHLLDHHDSGMEGAPENQNPDSLYQAACAMVAEADAENMSEPLLQMRGIALSHRDWQRRNEGRLQTRAAWMDFFRDYDVLLCPCAHVPAFPHDHSPDMHLRSLQVNGAQRPYSEILAWAGLTLNGYLPITAAPAGTTSDGLPVGVQIVAPFLGDRSSLAVAELLEQHHRTFVPPPGYGR